MSRSPASSSPDARLRCLRLPFATTLLAATALADFAPAPVVLLLTQKETTLQLSWFTESVITNAGRTPIYPKYVIQASTDLAYWWDTKVVIPQRVGGPTIQVQTNFAPVEVLPIVFLRVRSELNLAGEDLANTDFRGVDFDNVDGEYANFYGAILVDSIIRESDFSVADFRLTNLTDSEFERTDFRFCDFRGANWDDVEAWFCDFTGAQFWGPP